jgi:hypothetical protein
MSDFIEQRIKNAVNGLLTGRVNEKLNDYQFFFPLVEFSEYGGSSAIIPVVTLSSCERTEKERIIKQDAYTMIITFTIPEKPDSELYCYAYATAFEKALCEDITLGGVADRAVITEKIYKSPKKPYCGELWQLVISIRITVEGMK